MTIQTPSNLERGKRAPLANHSERIAVVLNESAKSVTREVIATIRRHLKNGDVFTSSRIDEATRIAETIIARGYGTVLTGGGDGTFTVTATEVTRAAERANVTPPRFGLLKLGTGNALVWLAGASPLADENPPADADRIARNAPTRDLYLVEVEGRRTPFAGIGADAQILADYNATKKKLDGTLLQSAGRGLLGYGVAALSRSLPALAMAKMPKIRVINTGEPAWPVDPDGVHQQRAIPEGGVIYEGRARLAAFSTIPYYGFGMRLFPFADGACGRMHLRILRMGSAQFVANVRGMWNGTYFDPETFSDFMVKEFRIECEKPVDFQIGGDSQGTRRVVEAKITPYPIQLVDFGA